MRVNRRRDGRLDKNIPGGKGSGEVSGQVDGKLDGASSAHGTTSYRLGHSTDIFRSPTADLKT
jgi:hypothetical protein